MKLEKMEDRDKAMQDYLASFDIIDDATGEPWDPPELPPDPNPDPDDEDE